MNKNTKHKKIFRFIYAIFLIVFIVCGIYISLYFYQGYKYNQELSSYVIESVSENDKTNEKDTENKQRLLYNNLKTKNSDLVAILTVQNYTTPIVQTNNNNFYLKKDMDKKYAFYGTPFLDYNNNSNFDNKNNIIYGHNMGDGKCFGYLKKLYSNENNSSIEIELITDSKIYKGSLVSCIYTSLINDNDYQQLLQLNFTDEEFSNYLDIINNKSYFKTDENIIEEDKLLTLYTCSYNQQDSKFLMIFKLVEQNILYQE